LDGTVGELIWVEVRAINGNQELRPGGEGADGGEGVEAEADDLAHEAGDVFGVGWAVGVEADPGAAVFSLLVLIDDPFEGRLLRALCATSFVLLPFASCLLPSAPRRPRAR